MRAQFVRGGINSRKEMIDRILNRIITVELEAHNVRLNDQGQLVRGIEDDTDDFLDILESSGVKWSIVNPTYPTTFEFSGTKEELIPVLSLWDGRGRSIEQLTKDLKDWDGNENELIDIMF